jgi:hypothetical protein
MVATKPFEILLQEFNRRARRALFRKVQQQVGTEFGLPQV